jgi:hypothetical protein
MSTVEISSEALALIINALRMAELHCSQLANTDEDAAILATHKGKRDEAESHSAMAELMRDTQRQYGDVRSALQAGGTVEVPPAEKGAQNGAQRALDATVERCRHGNPVDECGCGNDSRYCRHGAYVGHGYGPDYMCGRCEDGDLEL